MSTAMSPTPDIDIVHLQSDDNICVAVRNLNAGTEIAVNDHRIRLDRLIRIGHKIAVEKIAEGDAEGPVDDGMAGFQASSVHSRM